ncbi:MAG: hypothetical protein ACU0BN_19575 [Sulfitobacter sp.]
MTIISPEHIEQAFHRLSEACESLPVLIDCLDQAKKHYSEQGHSDPWFSVVLDVMFAMDMHDAGNAPDWFVERCHS